MANQSEPPLRRLEEIWPPYALQVRTKRLMLRALREADFPAYIQAVESGIVRGSQNPFRFPWNEREFPDLAAESLSFQWASRAQRGPVSWDLRFAVFSLDSQGAEAEFLGAQDVQARQWPVLRTVSSGSWLRADRQGLGYGTEMRAAMLTWAFDYAGARYARSGYYDWNTPSARVSRRLGYQVTGTERVPNASGVEVAQEVRVELAAPEFTRPADLEIEVTGHAALAEFYGLDAQAADGVAEEHR